MLLHSAAAASATYYVDGDLASDCTAGDYSIVARSCTGADGNAYDTIAEALAVVAQSDDVVIRAGRYFESGLDLPGGVAGTAADPIVISSYQGEKVFLTGGRLVAASAWSSQGGNVFRDAAGGPSYYRLFWAPSTGNDDDLEHIRWGYARSGVGELDEEGEYVSEYTGGGYDHYFHSAPGKTPADYVIIGTHCASAGYLPVFDFATDHAHVTFEALQFVASTGVIRTTVGSNDVTFRGCAFLSILGDTCAPGTRGLLLAGDNSLVDGCYCRECKGYFVTGVSGNTMETEGLTVQNSVFERMAGAAIHVGGTRGMIVRDCEFRRWGRKPFYTDLVSGDQNAIGHTPASGKFENLTIERCYFHDTDATVNDYGVDPAAWDAEVDGDDIGYAFECAGKYDVQGDGLVFRHNFLENVLGSGFEIYGEASTSAETVYRNVAIYGNVFALSPDVGPDGESGYHAKAISLAHNHAAGAVFRDWRIYGNTFYGYAGAAIAFDEVGIYENVEVKNNIFSMRSGQSYAFGYRFYDASQVADVQTGSNIFFRPDSSEVLAHGDVVPLSLAGWQAQYPGSEQGSLQADPVLVNPAGGDYALAASSPAVDAAAGLGAPYNEALSPASHWPGGVVTADQDAYGSGWEMGAFVWGVSTGGAGGGGLAQGGGGTSGGTGPGGTGPGGAPSGSGDSDEEAGCGCALPGRGSRAPWAWLLTTVGLGLVLLPWRQGWLPGVSRVVARARPTSPRPCLPAAPCSRLLRR